MHEHRSLPQLPLRLRRSLLGYRVADVEVALAHLRRQLDGLAASVDRLYRERGELQARLDRATDEQERLLREQAERLERVAEERVAVQRADAERVLAEARAEAATIVADAEEQAATLRHQAGIRVGREASRLEDLLRVRERLFGELRGLLQGYSELLGEREIAPLAAAPAPPADRPRPVQPLRGDDAEGLFPPHVDLDVGPFADFSELSAFERALARLPKVDDVYIRGFGDERATIELSLTEETPLVHDLAARLPYGLRFERDGDSRLVVDVSPRAAAAGE